ncbi:uncharacterized protein LOC131680971 [Topomyia yanbarensis]|uniref:uncharacterized protein LOC131680971 n=1 Tax=Topomyia yanbarensis TaxID=2498891 RepID=UPI00273AF399|nr:uncharacterized protein LOC131680971 [Topomyia yanbarensis]
MITRMRLPTAVIVLLLLLCLQFGDSLVSSHGDDAIDTQDDRELKTNDDGYDFLSIDQLFMNNPQYAKLLSDLQSQTFGKNWRRKRDTEDVPSDESPVEQPVEETNATTPEQAEIIEVTKKVEEPKQPEEVVKDFPDAEGRTTPLRTVSVSSTTAASSFGFSGSTEAERVRTDEPTTSASPIRSSTPRRLLHKGSNKNKNKGANKPGSHSTSGGGGPNSSNNNIHKTQDSGSLTATNVNKFTVTNTPASTSPVSSSSPVAAPYTSSSLASSTSNMAAAAASVANVTTPGSNSSKDKCVGGCVNADWMDSDQRKDVVRWPHNGRPNDEKEAFYAKLEEVYDGCSQRDVKIVIGDMNVQVGREVMFRPVIGPNSVHTVSNDNGQRCVNFAASRFMLVRSTFFPRKDIHKATWRSPDQRTENQIDHVLNNGRFFSDITNVRTYRSANIDSDHYLVAVCMRSKLSTVHNTRRSRTPRSNIAQLRNAGIAQNYAQQLKAALLTEEQLGAATLEDGWRKSHSAIGSTAIAALGTAIPN